MSYSWTVKQMKRKSNLNKIFVKMMSTLKVFYHHGATLCFLHFQAL